MTIAYHGYPDWQPGLGTAELIARDDLQTVNAGNSITSSFIDMRPYSSFGVVAETLVNAAITNFNTSGLTMTWVLDTVTQTEIWRDGWAVHNFNDTGSVFDCEMSKSFMQDNVRGPYMVLNFANNGPQQAVMSYAVYGNSRTVAGRSLRELNGVTTGIQQGTLSTLMYFAGNINAGVTRAEAIPMAPGPAHLVGTSGAGANAITIIGASGRAVWQTSTFTRVSEDLILPDESCIVRLINSSAGVLNMNFSLTSSRLAA